MGKFILMSFICSMFYVSMFPNSDLANSISGNKVYENKFKKGECFRRIFQIDYEKVIFDYIVRNRDRETYILGYINYVKKDVLHTSEYIFVIDQNKWNHKINCPKWVTDKIEGDVQ